MKEVRAAAADADGSAAGAASRAAPSRSRRRGSQSSSPRPSEPSVEPTERPGVRRRVFGAAAIHLTALISWRITLDASENEIIIPPWYLTQSGRGDSAWSGEHATPGVSM